MGPAGYAVGGAPGREGLGFSGARADSASTMARDDFEPGLDARSIARLAAMRRVSLGAAHSLNNAFTSAIGEATYLLAERKEDAELVECCQLILTAMERSTRITRGLLAHRGSGSDDETDLGRLLPELIAFLRETLGRGHPIEVSVPDEWIGVEADPADIDLVLMTLFQYAADASGEQSSLDATLEKRGGTARLTVQVSPCESSADVAGALNDPALAEDAITRASLRAARELIASVGGDVHAACTAPDRWAFVLTLPALSAS